MMNNLGLPALMLVLVFFMIPIVPFWKIFPRAGMSPWLSLFSIIPIISVLFLWVLAFKKWPGDEA